jgi:hypothetical protein
MRYLRGIVLALYLIPQTCLSIPELLLLTVLRSVRLIAQDIFFGGRRILLRARAMAREISMAMAIASQARMKVAPRTVEEILGRMAEAGLVVMMDSVDSMSGPLMSAHSRGKLVSYATMCYGIWP